MLERGSPGNDIFQS